MALQTKCTKLIKLKLVVHTPVKFVSKYVPKNKSAKVIRQTFIDYFKNEHNYTFVSSSPVIPFCDPSVPFVNAGMNQFKGIFLGTASFEHKKVTNSQKCIRIGGKHNDLNEVGTDGYHHTFFEMLGNWTFGECNKQEVCKLCLNLLSHKYEINLSRLYVTYFSGNEQLNIPPDTECKEIWRSLGISDDRILPFGMKDNFWEMGVTGPCGPCTEIHIDHLGTTNRSKFVNKNLPDLTELWNIVFIQFNKNADGSVQPLANKHVDTGLGLERLTAVLQGKVSNYNTDLFTYLFAAAEKICPSIPKYEGKFGERDWNGLDTAYRILADHTRMITVCLADGVIPEQNQKLRRIMRRVFQISETNFNKEKGLLKELTNYVVENLGCVYPEMERNIYQIQQIVDYEEEVYNIIKQNAAKEWPNLVKANPKLEKLDVIEMPGLIAACKEIQRLPDNIITPKFSFKLYDTYGLDEEVILKLSQALDLQFDPEAHKDEINRVKERSRSSNIHQKNELIERDLKRTDDQFKYDYKRNNKNYIFTLLEVKVEGIIQENKLFTEIPANTECELILNRTNFYTEAGGQDADTGIIQFTNGEFEVRGVRKIKECVLHRGTFKANTENAQLTKNDVGFANVDTNRRLNLMRNHTGVHLLNAALKNLKHVTCQKSSKVSEDCLKFDVSVFGKKLSASDLETVENIVHRVISEGVDVKITTIDSKKLYRLDHVTLIPGEIYPESDIRMVEIIGKDGFVSREPCCGTHVHNSADLEHFHIVSSKSLGRSTTSLRAVTGPQAKIANKVGLQLIEQVTNLQKKIDDNIDKPEVLDAAVSNLRKKLKTEDLVIPVTVKLQCLSNLNCIDKQVKQIAQGTLKEFVEMEMQNVLETNKLFTKNNQQYVIHYLRCSMILENVPLQKATQLCPDLPILVIAYSDGMVKARCCVPEKLKTKDFNAERWLHESVNKIFKSHISTPKGQDPGEICNMKARKVSLQEWDTLLNNSLTAAKEYVEKYL